MRTYLMLDKNDVTKVCGTITMDELMRGMGAKKKSQVLTLIHHNIPYKDKYIIVESDAGESSYRCERHVEFMTKGEDRFIVTESGKVYVEGYQDRQLKTPFIKGRLIVRCGGTLFTVARLVAKYINGWDIEGKRIGFKDGDPRNVRAENLIIRGPKRR